ncbi:MAG: oxidoreductase [Silanimonas sp.]|nr:MAG: oxidoreductase [Silanimonas sp.]
MSASPAATPAPLRAGFIGLGAMGGPMAGHLAARGLLAVAGNRSPEKAQAFVAARAGSPLRAAASFDDYAACDVVALCVSADADVLENIDGLAAVLPSGAIVIDHSTVAVETAREAARRLAARGIGFLDAPVSGGVEGARNGRLSVMVGGDEPTLERARPVLEAYGARIALMGPTGAGQATKAVNQILVAGINEAVCEGLAFAEKLGLDPERLLPTLMAGAASNWFLDKRGASMLRNEFTPGFKCAHMAKDLRIVQAMARQAGIRHPVIDRALVDYTELEARGEGELDTSALIRLKR